MDDDKVFIATDGTKYYPFDGNNIWIYNTAKDKWNIIPCPANIVFIPETDELLELVMDDDCVCNSRDLFHFGCRCNAVIDTLKIK